MSIDNPQVKVEGREAWRVFNGGDVHMIEPFYGTPKKGEIAVTSTDAWVYLGDNDWRRTHSEGASMLVAMLRFWLAAKAGWDNARRELTNKVAVLEELIEHTAIPKLCASGRPDVADYLTENLETIREA